MAKVLPNDKGEDQLVTKKIKTSAAAPTEAAGKGESNMANGAMPEATKKYNFAQEDDND